MSSDFYAAASNSSATSTTCSSSRWLTEEVFKLIDMVQRDEAIYNPRHKYYFCRPYVENFWREVDLKLEKNPGASLAKWTNLRISFRREYTNYLEEKVPPCWSYFDRMFFLHPYLRKKHQQPKSLDSQVQDALVQISSLSNRLQRERAVAAAISANNVRTHIAPQTHQPLDNYLEYFDDPEPINSELDEIIDDEQQSRFQHLETHSLNNDIKSECEDNVDDYEPEQKNEEDEPEADDTEIHNFVMDTIASTSEHETRQHLQRKQHLNRIQTRSYHDDLRAKRPHSQESISSSQASNNIHTQRILSSSTPTHSNVSFVRPTIAKPMDLVSTTTATNHGHTLNENDLTSTAIAPAASSSTMASSLNLSSHQQQPQQQHQRHMSHHHRLEISAVTSGSANSNSGTTSHTASAAAAHLELCDCKTDPDAMFLMSLLPDIQKLNGRDRGKIKIAFQNILQDYLYPD